MNDGSAVVAGTAVGLVIALLIYVVIGAVIGALARLVLPGRDDMSLGKTVLYGMGGAFLGGLAGRLLGVQNQLIGWALAIGMAALLIWFFTRRKPSA